MERIPAGAWREHRGHVERYRWAAAKVAFGERVNDIACGVGYGALFLAPPASAYHGYDKPGVPQPGLFPGEFHEDDIDCPAWHPVECDVTACFETLEHVKDPAHTASVISATTRRAIFVSVPVIPTTHCNEWHLTDFTAADIPPLFPQFAVAEDWYQEAETSHCWMFVRAAG